MTIVVQDEPIRSMFARLQQFEQWRCWWRLPVAAFLYATVPLLSVVAVVLAAFIARGGFDLRTAVAAAVVVLVATSIVGPRLARRQFHRKVIADRLWRYERPNPATLVEVLIRAPDLDAARAALRSEKFNPGAHSASLGSPPPDAQDLNWRFGVCEPEAWPQSTSDEDRIRRIHAALGQAGIRARVGGMDS